MVFLVYGVRLMRQIFLVVRLLEALLELLLA